MSRWPLVGSLLLLVACSSTSPLSTEPVPESVLRPAWEAMWQEDWATAFERLEDLGWERSGSVAGERLRHSVGLQLGRRGLHVDEVRRWRDRAPDEPDLAYLEARLAQHPERQRDLFRQALARWPQHPWLRLGSAAVELREGGSVSAAGRHLERAPDVPEARSFRRQLEARYLRRRGRAAEGLDRLYDAAFGLGDYHALATYLELSASSGLDAARERARSEIALRRLDPAAPAADRLDAAVGRVLAEVGVRPDLDLDRQLALLDANFARVGLPTGWTRQPRYQLGPIGSLLRPERGSGLPADAAADARGMLLVGSALFHGSEILFLQDADRATVQWTPGIELEIVVAGRARSSRPNPAAGGAVFRGFYVRRDLVEASAAGIRLQLGPLDGAPPPEPPPPPERRDGHVPEDLDLPLRLRAQVLGHDLDAAVAVELRDLAVHEAGHLPEILSWLDGGSAVWTSALPRSLWSLLVTGDALTWLEYRAQARALAHAPEPHWTLARIVETARGPEGVYQDAYEALLEDLLEVAAESGHPPLALWTQLGRRELRALGAAVCREQGLELLPREGVRAVLEALDGLEAERHARSEDG